MRKISTLLLGVLLVSTLSAQKPEALIMKASVAPEIDGKIDEVWAEANAYNIDKNFQAELPSLGAAGETIWRGLWTEDGIYILLKVTDDTYYPNYLGPSGSNDYMYDKTEIYFDVNYVLEDGLGCQSGSNGNKGHYQFAPSFTAANIDGSLQETGGYKYAIIVENPNYVQEYFIPMDKFVTNEGGPIDLTGQVGFDVTIIDRDSEADASRKRAVWANIGGKNESWANMDDAGIITFDGAEPPVFVDDINLTIEGAITEDDQTIQIGLEVLPEDASVKTVKWVVTTAGGGLARAKISPTGVVTPIVNEELIIQAVSSDGFVFSNEITLSISGQKPSLGQLSWIEDGFFDNADENGKVSSAWSVGANALVTDGVLAFGPDEVLTDPWSYTLSQRTYIPLAMKDMDFIISFKAWADAPRNMPLVLEDGYADDAQWDAYFTSTNEYYDGGKTYNIPLTAEPTVYKLHANFGPMKETTIQQFNFQVGKDTPKMYIDSIYIVSEADLALIPTAISQERAMETFRVYPNPASSKLHVEFSSPNTTVAIYNSVGVKMDEEVVFGTHHMFDVSRYSKGLYFVKANGAVVKFVK